MTKLRYQEDEAARLGYRTVRIMTQSLARRNHHTYREGTQGEPQRARLNHARWIADCPFCKGAEIVSAESPQLFCQSCGMKENGGHPMPVVFPGSRRQIEALVRGRPAENCNWEPHETKRDLWRDNQDHGIGV